MNRSRIHSSILALVCAAGMTMATPAGAAVSTFDSRADFEAANPGLTAEDWNNFSSGTTLANGSAHNGIQYRSSHGNVLVTSTYLTTTFPRGLGQDAFGYFGPGDSITFTFSGPVTSFGIDINTYSTANGSYTVRTNRGDTAASRFDPFRFNRTGQFAGFVSDAPFSEVTLSSDNAMSFTLDTLRIGAPPGAANNRFVPMDDVDTASLMAIPGGSSLLASLAGEEEIEAAADYAPVLADTGSKHRRSPTGAKERRMTFSIAVRDKLY